MSNQYPTATRIVEGALLGALAGVAGAFAMDQCAYLMTTSLQQAGEVPRGRRNTRRAATQGGQVSKRRGASAQPATHRAAERLARNVAGQRASASEKERFGQILHYAFGAMAGAVYGAVSQYTTQAQRAGGLHFGAAVWLAADEVAMPLVGLSQPPQDYKASDHLYSLIEHFVFGFFTDGVYRLLSPFARAATPRGAALDRAGQR